MVAGYVCDNMYKTFWLRIKLWLRVMFVTTCTKPFGYKNKTMVAGHVCDNMYKTFWLRIKLWLRVMFMTSLSCLTSLRYVYAYVNQPALLGSKQRLLLTKTA